MALGQILVGLASVIMAGQSLGNGLKELNKATGVPRQRTRQKRRGPTELALSPTAQQQIPPLSVLRQTMKRAEVRSLEERVKYIQGRVRKGTNNPKMYALARRIVSQKCGNTWCVPEKDNLAEAKAIFKFMRQNVRYTSDTLGVDIFQNPALTVGLRSGDCDDYTATTCALLLSIGIPCRFKVIQTKGAREPNHIYPQCGLPRAAPSKWYTMDSSVNATFGWEAPHDMIEKAWVFPPQ